MSESLFQKYGGFAVVSRIVMDFYERVLDSDQIGGYFEDLDMRRLIDHQTKFVASLMGGPASFSDERLQHVHAHLGIDRADFDEMKKLLGQALRAHNIAEGDVETVVAEIEARRGAIVAADKD